MKNKLQQCYIVYLQRKDALFPDQVRALSGFVDAPEFLDYARANPRLVVRPLLRIAEGEEPIAPEVQFSKMHFSKICKFLAGSFSAVSKLNFARKYAFDSMFQALQDLHTFAPLQSQNFSKKSVRKISKFCDNSSFFFANVANLMKLIQIMQMFAKFTDC